MAGRRRFGRWLVEAVIPFTLGFMLGAAIVAVFFIGILWGATG